MSIEADIKYLSKALDDFDFPCNWMSDEICWMLYSYIRFYKPDLVIHTGFLWGKSSAFILNALDDYKETTLTKAYPFNFDIACSNFVFDNSPKTKEGKLVAIDPNIFNLNIDRNVDYLKRLFNFDFYLMTSDEFFKQYKDELSNQYKNSSIIGVVDGDHTIPGCMSDLVNLADLRARIIFVDDTSWLPSLNDVCKEFAVKYNYEYINLPLYTGLGILTWKK